MTEAQRQQRADDDAGRAFAHNLIATAKILNRSAGLGLCQSIWMHSRLRALEITWTAEHAGAYTMLTPLVGVTTKIDLLNLVISGDLETAYICLACATPDAMTEEYHCLSPDLLYWLRNQIGIYLGWET